MSRYFIYSIILLLVFIPAAVLFPLSHISTTTSFYLVALSDILLIVIPVFTLYFSVKNISLKKKGGTILNIISYFVLVISAFLTLLISLPLLGGILKFFAFSLLTVILRLL